MENKVPKDLGLKIGSKEQAEWTTIAEKAAAEIRECQKSIIINEGIVKIAKEKAEEEKKKFES